MKKLIFAFLFMAINTLFAKVDKEPLTPGLWRFTTYLADGTIVRQSICIDYKRFWKVSHLNRVPGCRARLIRNSKRRKVWAVNCRFKNRNFYKGRVIYAQNYFEQRYWGVIAGKHFRTKTVATLKRAKVCPYSTKPPVSVFMPLESLDFNFPKFGE